MAAARMAQQSLLDATGARGAASFTAGPPRSWQVDNDSDTDSSDADTSDEEDDFPLFTETQHGSQVRPCRLIFNSVRILMLRVAMAHETEGWSLSLGLLGSWPDATTKDLN